VKIKYSTNFTTYQRNKKVKGTAGTEQISHLDCVYRLPDSVELFAAGEQIGANTLVVRQQLVQFESDKSVFEIK
jgi:hypothetical protein